MRFLKPHIIVALSVLCGWDEVRGQCVANFGTYNLSNQPVTEGCIPNMIIQFIDSSTYVDGLGNTVPIPYRTTPYESHHWEFNDVNNISSSLQNPVFGFFDPGTYCITLTVTPDGINYCSDTQCITVFDPPVVDFVSDKTSGCNPLNVCFTDSSSSPGDVIVSWLWDFCDGAISYQQNPCHTYTLSPAQNCFCVTLIVTNSKGCSASKSVPNMICIDRPPVVDFTVTGSQTLLCDSPHTTTFNPNLNNPSGNPVTYLWDFGDSSATSNATNPTHTYPNTNRVYTVTLTVTDVECNYTVTKTKTNYITTRVIDAAFVPVPPVVCQGGSISFVDFSVGQGLTYSWNFGDGTPLSNSPSPSHTYNNSNTYNVTLTLTDNAGCTDAEVVSVTVNPRPTVDFTANPLISCQSPLVVHFQELSDATSFTWSFGDFASGAANTSALPNPDHTYQQPGNYPVTLEVTNAFGCTNTLTKTNYIRIEPTQVCFYMDIDQGCVPLTVRFIDCSQSIELITDYWWIFGDPASGGANNSPLPDPVHTFNAIGSYKVCLTIQTISGCTGTLCDTVIVGNRLTPVFSIDDDSICVNEVFSVTNLTDTNGLFYPTTFLWDFCNNQSDIGYDPTTHVSHEPDTCDISLLAVNNGCVSDTVIPLVILKPKADFSITQDCDSASQIKFFDESEGAQQWIWIFGDGNTLTIPDDAPYTNPITHVYNSSGSYIMGLTVRNFSTGCQHTQVAYINISITNADFDADKYVVCAGLPVSFQDQTVGQICNTPGCHPWSWDFGDGSTSFDKNPSHVYAQADTYTVSLKFTDVNNCTDTETKTAFIRVSSVMADFSANRFVGCIPPTIPPGSNINNTFTFYDRSTSSPGSNIVFWKWDYGDTLSYTYTAFKDSTKNTYDNPGAYPVSLTVTNNDGCKDTSTRTNYIQAFRPTACFSLDDSLYCRNQAFQFHNCIAGGGITSVCYDFGDGSLPVCGDYSPYHTYTDTGCYDVKMWIANGIGCVDTVTKPSVVCIGDPYIDIIGDDTVSVCPPLLVCFTSTASFGNYPVTSCQWDFGDGSHSTLCNPCHIYTRAGLFTVTFTVMFANNCVDSVTVFQYINVGGAIGNITAEPDTGCTPITVSFDANSIGAISHYWIWNDGEPGVLYGTVDTASHTYVTSGAYQPAVVLTDTQIPPCSYVLWADFNIASDTLYANFFTSSDTVCKEDPIQFTDSSTSLIADSIVHWEWDFGDTTPIDTNQNPVHSFTKIGPDTVTLTATNSFGCISSITKYIYVRDKPNAVFTVSDDTGCDSLLVNFFDASTPGVSAPLQNWYWDFGDTNTTTDVSNIRSPASYMYPQVGQYQPYLVVTDADGCDDTATATINVYQTPVGILTPDTLTICQRDTVQLLADTGYAAYQWTPVDSLNNPAIANPLAHPSTTTSYAVLITEGHGCDKRDTVTVIVIPLPPLAITPYPDTAICLGDTVQLNAVGGMNHTWFPPTFLSATDIPNPVASPLHTITYTVTNEGANGCHNYDTVQIIVSILDARFVGERNCIGDPTDFIDFSTSSDLPIQNWTWDFGDPASGLSNSSALKNPSHLYTRPDSFTAQLVIEDNIGCTDTAIGTIIIDTFAIAVAGVDTAICLGESVSLFSSGGSVIYWTPTNDTIFNPTVTPLFTTTYVAHLTNGVCPYDSAEVLVTVIPQPVILTRSDTTILRGNSIELTTTVDRYDSIRWTGDSLSCFNCLSPFASPDEETTYYVTVIDEHGCTSTDSVTITIDVQCKDEQIFVPNAITPNDDGNNDEVHAHLNGLEKMNYFRIYDRWGKLMFETDDVNEGWDGTNRAGRKLNSGVFVYVCEAVCFYKKTIVRTGNITLIK